MDFNIACALYFASKCEGYKFKDNYYTSENFLKLKCVLDIAREEKLN